ncbi:MAG: J domain-containing protein [Pelagibacteraceae bacterium]|nr:J domain-containing protein [Pelagibacteraceae bacterium]|tara:strand:+ start:2389 stop:2808 length:420 start_codon:yes stop_codon:yes gene_type:complete
MDKKTFSGMFKFGIILISVTAIILLILAGRYLLSLPFFAVIGTAIKRSVFNFVNLVYLYRLVSVILKVRKNRSNGTFTNSISEVNESYKILGLERNCSRQEIINAHKKKIKQAHPDKSGSNELASKINRARDILLEIHK